MHPGSIPGQASIAISLRSMMVFQIGAVIQPIAPAPPTAAATTAIATAIRTLRLMNPIIPAMSSSPDVHSVTEIDVHQGVQSVNALKSRHCQRIDTVVTW